MAIIKKDGTYSGIPMGFRRNNPIPLDHDAVWYSLEEAQTYAATNPVAYVGQILVVIDEINNTSNFYGILNTVGDLVQLDLDQADLDEAVEKAEAAADRAGSSATTAGNWASQAIQAAVNVEKKFWYGTIAEYNALEVIYPTTIYVILDD